VRNVGHRISAHLARDPAYSLEVYDPRISGCTGDDQLRFMFVRQFFGRVIVDQFGVRMKSVRNHLEPLAADVDRRAVGEVTAVRQRHAENLVARLQRREEHRLIRLRTGMRLHIGGLRPEQFFNPVDRELLGDIDEFAAAVIAFAGIALGVFIGELRPLSGHHHRARVILRRDQLDVIFLALVFGGDGCPDFGIALRKCTGATEHGRLAW